MPIPAKLRAPGWYRAALFDVPGFGFAFGLTVLIRTLMHAHPVADRHAIPIVALMAFPRLNALSYWMLPMAGLMMLMSFLAPGGSFASGWTAYAPLSTTMPLGQLFFTIAVQLAGASSIATALNFLVTIITMRAPGMSFFRMPLLVWANFSTSLLVVIATPFIAASQFFVLLDRALGFHFFDAFVGLHANGDVLMY